MTLKILYRGIMINKRKLLDTSNELILQRFGNGIQLIRPDKRKFSTSYPLVTVKNILQSSFHVYFLNRDNIVKNVNDVGAAALGVSSVKSFIGHTPLDLVSKECALQLKQSNNVVMTNRAT